MKSINHCVVNDKAKTLNSFWFIFNARKSKKKILGANMSLDAIAAVQKTTSVGLFLALPQAKHSKCKFMPNFLGWRMHRSILGG